MIVDRRRIDGVVFDLDGVLIDSEHLWEEAWLAAVRHHRTVWTAQDTRTCQGMSVPEWSRYISDLVADGTPPDAIADEGVEHVIRRIRDDGEGALLPGARDAVVDISSRVPVALASSAARRVIDAVLIGNELQHLFSATVSSEEVAAGKPSPDVYLEAVARLGAEPGHCVAIEDSTNGLLAAAAAGLMVVAVPNRTYPPLPEVQGTAAFVASDLPTALMFLQDQLTEITRS